MDYQAAVAYVLSLTNYERLPLLHDRATWDLRRVQELLSLVGDPHVGPVTIHVAGSKGKGSTCALLASALTSSGYKTGLYTSPHLHSIRERIAVDGTPISEEDFATLMEELRPCVEEVNDRATYGRLSTFEVLTALAFLRFRSQKVDAQVVEVGLGGRLDATNVLQPTVCVITSISYDHTQMLGETLREIAGEKAGIIKPGVHVVSAPQHPEAMKVIEDRCAEMKAPLTLLGRDLTWRRERATREGQEFRLQGHIGDRPVDHELRVSLLGAHQMENASAALAALELLRDAHHPVPFDGIQWGFQYVRWPGRLEIVRERPLVVLDGAHNVFSAMRLAEAIREDFPHQRLYLVLGTSSDKNTRGIAAELATVVSGAAATAARHPRATAPSSVADALWEASVPVRPIPEVSAAVDWALKEAQPEDMVLVTGSLFVVAEAREHLLGIAPELYPQ